MKPPVIIVSIVHIQGPLKGEIQEFAQETINVGRHLSNDVRFPKDLAIVSRKHAEIVREGNRFRLSDNSANGTFVNGKRVTEAFLKNGDVIEFAEGGPKVSFLMEVKEEGATQTQPRKIENPSPPLVKGAEDRPSGPSQVANPQPPPEMALPSPPSKPVLVQPQQERIVVQTSSTPLVIQYGPAVLSYKELPVNIGRHQRCDFVIDKPWILDHHAQIFFALGQYWLKDLTGQAQLRVNGGPVMTQTALSVNDIITFGPKGPGFRVIGEGRLAEVEELFPENVENTRPTSKDRQNSVSSTGEKSKKRA